MIISLTAFIYYFRDIPPADKKGRKKSQAKTQSSQPEHPTTPQYTGL
jgi:hypothetical protein